jgi:hypothetical protein
MAEALGRSSPADHDGAALISHAALDLERHAVAEAFGVVEDRAPERA